MGEPVFVDTNVFLRFFVRDVESLYNKAKGLFEKAENGEITLETSEMVIAEIVWVLESYYGFTKTEIEEVVDTILETRSIRVANHTRLKEAIKLYALSNIDFIDAYNIAYMKARNYQKVATFDIKHFKNIEGIKPVW